MYAELSRCADALQTQVSAYRRDFHRFAENGWFEMRTSSRIARKLSDLGYEVLTGKAVCKGDDRLGVPPREALDEHYRWAAENGADPAFLEDTRDGFTGVVGILRCGDGPTVAMRFDIDALAVHEVAEPGHPPHDNGFASAVPGMMHACGHDGHAAIGLGVAELLANIRETLSGTVKLIFQPAEEGVQGAKSIVANGHLDDVDFVVASHVMASTDGGISLCPGMAGTLATSKLDVWFTGKSAHAGMAPQEGKNALLAASTAIVNLYAIPRHGDGRTAINVGCVQADGGRNVVPDRVYLELEVRGGTTKINDYMHEYAVRVLQSAADMHGCGVEMKLAGGAPTLACTDEFTERIGRLCSEHLNFTVHPPAQMGGSEDFSYMADRVMERGGQACFVGIEIPMRAPIHNVRFDFDEAALSAGMKLFAAVAFDILGKDN